MNGKKIDTLNFYKAAGACMVILIHVTASPAVSLAPGSAYWAVMLVNRLCKPAVPMFIFASGLALYNSYREKEFHYGAFLSRRFSKILIPYVIWSAVYYGYYVWKGIYAADWSFFIVQTANGSMMYHFYFIVCILQFYLLFGIIRIVVQKGRASVVIPVAVIINLISYAVLPAFWITRAFLTSLVYFLAGCYFAKDYARAVEWLKRWSVLLIPVFLLSAAAYCAMFYFEFWDSGRYMKYGGAVNYIYAVFCTTGLLVYFRGLDSWCCRAGSVVRKAMDKLNAGSYYIYLSHPLGLIIGGSLAARLGTQGVLDIMAIQLAVVAVLFIPACIFYAEKKHTFLKRR